MVFVARLEIDGYPSMKLILESADEIALVALLSASLYLAVSCGR